MYIIYIHSIYDIHSFIYSYIYIQFILYTCNVYFIYTCIYSMYKYMHSMKFSFKTPNVLVKEDPQLCQWKHHSENPLFTGTSGRKTSLLLPSFKLLNSLNGGRGR